MGRVRLGPPKDLVSRYQSEFGVDIFVETGTYQGDTAGWASDVFDHVITVELDESLYQDAVAQYDSTNNIRFLHGKSQDELQRIVPELDGSAVF